MSENPYESPRAEGLSLARKMPRWKLSAIARLYRLSWIAMLLQVGLHAWQTYYSLFTLFGGVHLGTMPSLMIIFICSAAVVFPLTHLLRGIGEAVICAALMIVPFLSIAVLLIVNRKAIRVLQSQGIEVGLFDTEYKEI